MYRARGRLGTLNAGSLSETGRYKKSHICGAGHRNALEGASRLQVAHLTSQVGKRDKDSSSLIFQIRRAMFVLQDL